MRKIMCLVILTLVLTISSDAFCQTATPTRPTTTPFIMRGNQELGLSGNIDFEGPTGDVDIDLNASYGYFIRDLWEIGGLVNFSRELGGDVMRYGLGGFAEYHFRVWESLIPYAGVSVGLQFVDVDFAEDNAALVFIPRIGMKWFLRDYFAIDTNLFAALATDDIYVNDEDLDMYDIGINLGLRIYFD